MKRYSLKGFLSVEEGDFILDIGAFIGEFSIPASKKARKVIAIEPDKRSFECLTDNIKNKMNIFESNDLAWKIDKKITFKSGMNSTDSSTMNVDSSEIEEEKKIDALKIDSILREEREEKIDFLKVDAEGAEPEVLRGAQNTRIKKCAIDCGKERYGESTKRRLSNYYPSGNYRLVQT